MVGLLMAMVLGLAILALVACNSGATPMTSQPTKTEEALVSSSFVNSCAYRAPEPTPTPDLTPPPSTPFSNTTPIPYPTERPSADVVAYPDLPPPAPPASVKAWQDAVVRVTVELASGRIRHQQGLVVADKAVLTVLDLMEEGASLSVDVSGLGAFAAELERFDPRTGAALVTVEVEGLTVAPGERTTVAHGEPVLILNRDRDSGDLVVGETFASPSLNAPDHIFALRADYTRRAQRGATVVTGDGTPVGLAGYGRRWYGHGGPVVFGQIGGTDLPAVMFDSAFRLLELGPPDAGITPSAVAYHGAGRGRPVDGPVTRELLAEPVRATLRGLGEPVLLENLGRHPGYVLRFKSGTMLELLYATPQELRGANRELLGSARYIVLWWAREGGVPDLVLCGTDREHLAAAFAVRDLRLFEAFMDRAPSSSPHSMVAAAPLDAPEYGYSGKYGYSSEDYQYPFEWELKTDKSAYVRYEPVALTYTITNASDWPVPLDYVPPRVVIHSLQEHRDVAVLRYGDGRRVLQPDETASFTMTWDQMHFEGGRAPAGRYVAHVHLANVADNWLLTPGPTAYDVILE